MEASEGLNGKVPVGAKLDFFDLLLLCWIVLALGLTSGRLIGSWAGKAHFAVTEIAILAAGIVYLKARRLNISEVCRWRAMPASSLIPLTIAAVGGAILLDGLDRLVALIIPMPAEQAEQLVRDVTPANKYEALLVILGLGVAAPLAEESLFRGAIQQWFEARADVTKAVLLAALLFSLIHLQVWWLIQLLLMSALLGYLAWRWQSILPAMLLHGANNLWSFCLLTNQGAGIEQYYLWHRQLNPLLALVATALLMGGLRWSERRHCRMN